MNTFVDNYPVALKGNRQSLTVILSIDDNLFQALPHKLQTGATISVHPVLISHSKKNKSLLEKSLVWDFFSQRFEIYPGREAVTLIKRVPFNWQSTWRQLVV